MSEKGGSGNPFLSVLLVAGLWLCYLIDVRPHQPGEGTLNRLGRATVPSAGHCRAMIAELVSALGTERAVSAVLGIPLRSLRGWIYTPKAPSAAATRAIWLTWVWLLHPERCRTMEDLVCWGRFRPVVGRRPRPPGRSFRLLVQPDFMDGDGI